ncbi:hypothetical protein G6F64_014949 [Rhizopus arrhizus]|uniref:Uncharacterized protein n=1 Tax=Rhizopus oryzae TaxID=64495 RepID=A0A9P6WSH1_RHIOR|nr:hypothetical protein G6F24_018202 [Rhizopus arrhizus]KAG1275195.1 hypothetical protein G6F64_014949 [Rhizopus arrhizus]
MLDHTPPGSSGTRSCNTLKLTAKSGKQHLNTAAAWPPSFENAMGSTANPHRGSRRAAAIRPADECRRSRAARRRCPRATARGSADRAMRS